MSNRDPVLLRDRITNQPITKGDTRVGLNQFVRKQNLAFEYEVLNWNFGRRTWHLFSTDLAERVILNGSLSTAAARSIL